MRLTGEGLRFDLPRGWEGGITRNPARSRSARRAPFDDEVASSRRQSGDDADEASTGAVEEPSSPADKFGPGAPTRAQVEAKVRDNLGPDTQVEEDGGVVMPVTHVANFALPAALDVFGTQVVSTMVPGDNFVSLVEYGPAEVDTPLFERRGLPRRLAVRDFSPKNLNRTVPDQAGLQVFATEAGRAFCLYVVLAGRARIGANVRDVNSVLSTLEIQPR